MVTPAPAAPQNRAPFELDGESVAQYCQVLEWALDVRLSNDQKAEVDRMLRGYAERGDREQLEQVRSAVETQIELSALTPAERRAACAKNLPGTMRKLDEDAAAGQYQARWTLRIYYAAHPATAPGPPPLTRDLADCWIALDAFLRRQVLAEKPDAGASPSAKLRLARAKWQTLPTAERYRFMALPAELAEVKQRWPKMSPAQRRELRLRSLHDDRLLLGPPQPRVK
jgi:hypothetical protein